jgi:hypothetical protein
VVIFGIFFATGGVYDITGMTPKPIIKNESKYSFFITSTSDHTDFCRLTLQQAGQVAL